ncbi:MAG: homoserine dehydrogenase [Flammeovirgaceae bacterium]|nr:homoserine dehydrogenase [Flammeovirgaceae bacterium]
MKKKLNIGLFGFGCVGKGIYEVLQKTTGVNVEIKTICIRSREKKRSLPEHFFTYNPASIIQDNEIDVVVELINDSDAAFEILKSSLASGKHVVTANKKMVAEHLSEIIDLQKRHQRSVLYEGAVCGSIPVLRNLEEYYNTDSIISIEGICNGTTNYILTKMVDENLSFNAALTQAQTLGFAESNPDSDVKGFDARYKLSILIAHAFGVLVPAEKIPVIGIDLINSFDQRFAKKNKLTIKLIAKAWTEGTQLFASVSPTFLSNDNILSSINNEINAVRIEGKFSGNQVFIGRGAGSHPTAAAVLSDISALNYNYKYAYHKMDRYRYTVAENYKINAFVRTKKDDIPLISEFETFHSGNADHEWHSISGNLSSEKLWEWSQNGIPAIINHPVTLPAER